MNVFKNHTRYSYIEEVIKTFKKKPHDKCILWPGITSKGYGVLTRKGKTHGAHRLALIFYLGYEEQDLEASHGVCNNSLCINPTHLSWKTPAENNLDKKRDGTILKGSEISNSKLKESDVEEIKKRFLNGGKGKDLAKEFNISESVIAAIKKNKIWSHVDWNDPDYENILEEKSRIYILSDKEVLDIKTMILEGFSISKIASKTKASYNTIMRIYDEEGTWDHIPWPNINYKNILKDNERTKNMSEEKVNLIKDKRQKGESVKSISKELNIAAHRIYDLYRSPRKK